MSIIDIGISTLSRWQCRLKPSERRNKLTTKIDMDQLLEGVKARADDYQWERAERFGVTQRAIGLDTNLNNFFRQINANHRILHHLDSLIIFLRGNINVTLYFRGWGSPIIYSVLTC